MGIPAAVMCAGSIVQDLARVRPLSVAEVLIANIGVFLLLWLCVTIVAWGFSHVAGD